MNVAHKLFRYVETTEPETYRTILHTIRPHSLEAVLRLFQLHLEHTVTDLKIFQDHLDKIPELCLQYVVAIRRQFPSPGDAFGIQLTCRLTKSDTQGTLDSKHLRTSDHTVSYNVDYALKYTLNLFTNHTQVFELATTRKYASVYTKNYSVEQLVQRLPNAGLLERGGPFHKGKNKLGEWKYLSTFTFIVVPNQVVYRSFKDLQVLLSHLKVDCIVGISDIRYMFQKCGLISHFFNMIKVVHHQLLPDMDSVYAQDVLTVVKYQCRTGKPLPLTRDGLVKNPERSPIEILNFEAPKKNFARLCTVPEDTYPVKTSADKIFFGQQFNEGTGYRFEVRPQ